MSKNIEIKRNQIKNLANSKIKRKMNHQTKNLMRIKKPITKKYLRKRNRKFFKKTKKTQNKNQKEEKNIDPYYFSYTNI